VKSSFLPRFPAALHVDLPEIGQRAAFLKDAVRCLQEHDPEPATGRMVSEKDIQIQHLAGDVLVFELEAVNGNLSVSQSVLPTQPPSLEGHSRRLIFSTTTRGSSRPDADRARKPSFQFPQNPREPAELPLADWTFVSKQPLKSGSLQMSKKSPFFGPLQRNLLKNRTIRLFAAIPPIGQVS
jgi:hypothetical protein